MELRLTSSFDREYRKLRKGNPQLQKLVEKQLGQLQKNPQHPSLRLHKIRGAKYWSISVDMSLRMLVILEKNVIVVFSIGKHEDVYL